MNHYSDERALALAKALLYEQEMSSRDLWDLRHAQHCPECFRLLQVTMGVLEITDSIPAVELSRPSRARKHSATIIKITVLDVAAILEQLRAAGSQLSFSPALGGVSRGEEADAGLVKLQGDLSARSFVVYDPETRTLMLQLEHTSGDSIPKAYLRLPDGSRRDIVFEQEGDLLFAEVTDLPNGEYELIIEQ